MTFEIVESAASSGELADQINTLHAEMTGHMTMAVKKAIELGRLLTDQKASLAHGEWITWVESNLTFNDSQARKYMRVYRNRHRSTDLLDGATSINQAVALLAEPKDQPVDDPDPEDGGPDIDPEFVTATEVKTPEPEPKVLYQTDPDIERRLRDAEELATDSERLLVNKNQEYHDLSKEHERLTREVQELRKLKADKEKVEDTLRQLNDLKARKEAMFKDAESTKVAHQVLVRSREFFTREVMQLAALHIRPGAVDAMQQDFRGLIDLVENWLDAMKERFIKDE